MSDVCEQCGKAVHGSTLCLKCERESLERSKRKAPEIKFEVSSRGIRVTQPKKKTPAKLKPSLTVQDMYNALKGIAARFPVESLASEPGRCRCIQFEDNKYCRHLYVLEAIAAAEKAYKL